MQLSEAHEWEEEGHLVPPSKGFSEAGVVENLCVCVIVYVVCVIVYVVCMIVYVVCDCVHVVCDCVVCMCGVCECSVHINVREK